MPDSRSLFRVLWLSMLAVAGVGACAAMGSQPPSTGRARASTTPSTSPSTAQVTATLTVTVKDLRNRQGDLIFGVFAQADGFPNMQAKAVYWQVKPADAAAVTFTAHLPPGRYAAGVLHDENKSGDMDTGLGGIP